MTKHLLYTTPWISLCVSPPNTVIRIVSCVWIVYFDLTTISQQVIFCTGEHHKVTSYRVRNLLWINDSYRNQLSYCWPHYRSILICGRYPSFIKELNEQAPCLQDLPVRQDVPTDGGRSRWGGWCGHHESGSTQEESALGGARAQRCFNVKWQSFVGKSWWIGQGGAISLLLAGKIINIYQYIYIKIFGFKA